MLVRFYHEHGGVKGGDAVGVKGGATVGRKGTDFIDEEIRGLGIWGEKFGGK